MSKTDWRSTDVILATRKLQSPSIGFVPCLITDLEALLSSHRAIEHPLRKLGQGFHILTEISSYAETSKLELTLWRLAQYSVFVDDYLAGRSSRETLSVIGELRSLVQHDLMSLLSNYDDDDLDIISFICLRAAIIYSLLCTFPIPAAPFTSLIQSIKSSIIFKCSAEDWERAPRLIIWVIFMASIASEGTMDQLSFLSILERCLGRLNIKSWPDLKEILLSFLWLPITNDVDGITLWQRVVKSNPLSS